MNKFSVLFSVSILLLAGTVVIQCQTAIDDRNLANNTFKTGAEWLTENDFGFLAGKNIGIITNHTATVGTRHIADILHEADDVNVIALFGPEHGIRGDAPAGEKITFETDEATGLPVYSLYGDIHKPTPEMLEGIEVLVFDIQDVGARFYTYLTTMVMGMEAAAEAGISFMVLDRPNPLGGELVDGFVREKEFESFVGYLPIPVVYGLTAGELAVMVKGERMVDGLSGLDLHVIQLQNWSRNMTWPDLNRSWNPPSPNIPDFETSLIYPGACFFEGVSASEGRGTHEPFIQLGAPWADGEAIAADLNARNLPGLKFEKAEFVPESIPGMAVNPSHMGTPVQGIRYVITERGLVRPVEAGVHVLHAFYKYAPQNEKTTFFNPPQEGRQSRIDGPRKSAIVRLAGTDQLYKMIENGATAEEIIRYWSEDLQKYDQMRRNYFIYK